MSLNKFMHPRNPYKNNKPDFKKLALEHEEFRKVGESIELPADEMNSVFTTLQISLGFISVIFTIKEMIRTYKPNIRQIFRL